MAGPPQLSPDELARLMSEDQSHLTIRIIVAFTVLAFISVSLRIFTRLRYQGIGHEDYTIILAMIFTLATSILQVLQAKAGNGKHVMFIAVPEGIEKILKYLWWSIMTYNIGLTLIKASIILQYQRIFTVRKMRITFQLAMGLIVAWGIIWFFAGIFSCVPVSAYWTLSQKPTARCIPDHFVWFVNAAMSIFTDILLAALPINGIWGLQMPRRQKMVLIGILTIGWIVCVISFVRLHSFIVLTRHPNDQTYYSAANAYWSSIELNLGIVCASLPALKPLVVKIIPEFASRHSERGYGTAQSGGINISHGLSSKVIHTSHEDVEMGRRQTRKEHGQSIHVTQHFDQQFEEHGHSSDSESQKDLVVPIKFPSP